MQLKPRRSKLERYSEELLAIKVHGSPGLRKTHIRNHVEVDMAKLADDLIYLKSFGFVEYDEVNKTYNLTPQGMIVADYYSKWRKAIMPKIQMEEI